MNGQLPPIDPDLRVQLARRSAGRAPATLLAEMARALDGVGAKEPRTSSRPRPGWRLPRLAVAGVGAALVVVLAVALALPALRPGPVLPAAPPAQGALTTAGLATLMSGSELPANTTLVASVTIDSRQDVCPMNSRVTIGVVEGMASQVCVMGDSLYPYLTTSKVKAMFAFRYLAPGYLGLIGQISPASPTKVAFGAVDEWPQDQMFLVEGWLGAVETTASCSGAPTAGDLLNPSGGDCPYDNWLGTDSTAPGIEADLRYDPAAPTAADDPLSLRGNARHVEAGGMRLIDSIDHAKPVHGVYVVGSTNRCPPVPPQPSMHCVYWHVLARVSNVGFTGPTPTPSATPTPTSTTSAPPATPTIPPSSPLAPVPAGLLGSGNRPLTPGELATIWAADPNHLAGRTAIVTGPVPTGFECRDASASSSAASPACDVAVTSGEIAADGYWAVKVGADGKLSLVGAVSIPNGSFVYSYDGARNAGIYRAGAVMVDAWLDWQPSLECEMPPYPSDSLCGAGAVTSYLTAMKLESFYTADSAIPVQLGAYQIFGSEDLNARPIHGVYLIRWESSGVTILARLEAVPGA